MIIKGMYRSEYEGHPYARLLCEEDWSLTAVKKDHYGINLCVVKMDLDFYEDIKDEFDLYNNQEVSLSFDRWGKCNRIDLIG